MQRKALEKIVRHHFHMIISNIIVTFIYFLIAFHYPIFYKFSSLFRPYSLLTSVAIVVIDIGRY